MTKLSKTLQNIEELKDELMAFCNNSSLTLAVRAKELHDAPDFLKENFDYITNLQDCCPTLKENEEQYRRQRYQKYHSNQYLWILVHLQEELDKSNKIAENLTEEEFLELDVSDMDCYNLFQDYENYQKFITIINEILGSCVGHWKNDW